MEELFGVFAPGGGFLGDANTPGTNDLSDFFNPPVALQLPPAFADAGSFQNANPGVSSLTVPFTHLNGVNQQAVNLTRTTSFGGLPNDFTTPTGTGNVLGADQAISDLDFSILPSGHLGDILTKI
jgi:hypothetical protein